MAQAFHGEGPVVVQLAANGLSAKARFNGSEAVIAEVTGDDAGDTAAEMVVALETTSPWGNLWEKVPVLFTRTNDRTPFPI